MQPRGQYRLTRPEAKYTSGIEMDDPLEYLTGDCAYWRSRHPYRPGLRCLFL
ncbi:MAG: hypothetical protein WDN02_02050 [Methylovirgula sp.]|uniref:hypothetical protein n=1 Tax=Methylovirgula sp. TaxID=1978224 RepID=UPI00307622A6